MKIQCLIQKLHGTAFKAFLVSVLTVLVTVTSVSAQNHVVNGVVKDISGETLPGVSVMVKGNIQIGTSTDVDGKYSLKVPDNATLIFSFIGMKNYEESVNGRSVINVVLKDDTEAIADAVVIGYGTTTKAHLTGSVASVSNKEMLKTTASNMSQTLVGKLPGLITQQSLGAPGSDDVSIMVRGYSSYNGGGTPLMLVDGVERPMWRVDPADVESVTILKDAAACAVYGMKGASGVILVTTKKGQEGRTSINYKGSLTLNHATAIPKMMNGTQYMQYYNLALQLDGKEPFFTNGEIEATMNGDPTDGFENTDWTSPMYKVTTLQQHNLSVSGGSKKVQYYISGGYNKHNGIIKNHRNERTNFRSNLTARPNDNFKIDLNLAGRIQNYYQPGGYSYENQKSYNIFHLMLYSLPFVPKEYDGMPTSAYRTDGNAANAIYGSEHSGFTKSKTVKIETSSRIEYSFPFLEGLKASMFLSWDWQDLESKTFNYAYDLMQYNFKDKIYSKVKSANLLEGGNLHQGEQKQQQVILRPQISFEKTFDKHYVNAMLMYEQTQLQSSSFTGSRQKFALYDLPELSFGAAATASNAGSRGRSAYAGYVGRVNYTFNDKYLAEVSARYDGSYLFAKGHRWGFFPSMSLGWMMSKEPFFRSAFPNINYFKLRTSVGELGMDNVAPFLYRKNFEFAGNAVAFGQSPVSESILFNKTPYVMEDLTWEKTRTFDLGFELDAWKGLLGVDFDFFYKYTYDILQNIGGVYPPSLGGNFPKIKNNGSFDNTGFEMVLKHKNHKGEFFYSLNANLTYSHNRILSKEQSDGTLPWQSVLGSQIGDVWGLKSDGLYQSQEEIDNAPKPIAVTPRIGDIKYVDINGDGKITDEDRVKIAKNSRPAMMYAFTADFNWKGFDLSIMFQGGAVCDKLLQGKWYNYSGHADMTPLTTPWYANYDNAPLYLMENSWTPMNTKADYPRLSVSKESYTNNSQISDFWVRNGAYLRLKNVNLGYTLPKKLVEKVNISNVRLYVSGQNLLTFTNFKYIDPESANVITGYYPQQRTFSFGVDISF